MVYEQIAIVEGVGTTMVSGDVARGELNAVPLITVKFYFVLCHTISLDWLFSACCAGFGGEGSVFWKRA